MGHPLRVWLLGDKAQQDQSQAFGEAGDDEGADPHWKGEGDGAVEGWEDQHAEQHGKG